MSSSYATVIRRDSSDSAPPTAQAWAPPKNPLPPHRLARLANALGVSTPMPAIHTPSPMMSPSYNGTDQFRRSPTPSSASTFGFAASSSKYLLHVIPPVHLPHDDGFDSELTPPPSSASGYHTQFRRGTLVPVHPTLQSQLGAIAREYALPSTTGLILYLVSQQPQNDKPGAEQIDEPGPRLSEEIWRHLWTRVVKTELRDEGMSLAPPLLGLGMSSRSLSSRSTPYLSHEPLPLLSTNGLAPLSPAYPFTPSPTTPSSTSDAGRFPPTSKSAPPSSSSRSPSEAETPDTSQAASERADSLDLPGLGSGALIPILAKVEFDVDRRKAAWYDPWLRSRRMNHAKRAESRGRKNSGYADSSADDEEERRSRAPLALRLNGRKQTGSPASFLSSATGGKRPRYLPLSESPNSMTGTDSEDDDLGKDPLDAVFGADAATWTDMRANQHPRPQNPHVVQLALSGAELSPAALEEARASGSSEGDEVREVVELMGRAQLGRDIPAMHRSMSTRRAPPPSPLVLHPGGSSAPAAPPAAPPEEEEEAMLSYLDDTHDAKHRGNMPRKSIYNPDKRVAGIFDMDLGFEVPDDDFDVDDPNDRRKSQIVMRAQLDQIEKNLAQFSPRKLSDSGTPVVSPATSPHLVPPGPAPYPPVSNADVFPPTPRLPHHPNIHDSEDSDADDLSQQAVWPAVPFTSLPARTSAAAAATGPPQLAVNGVSAAMPRMFRAGGPTSPTLATSESELRRRDLAEETALYPALTPSIGPKSSLNSPLIPLSPDPFGRHPSQLPRPDDTTGNGKGARQSVSYWDAPVVIPAPEPEKAVGRKGSIASFTETKSSRFSTDSTHGEGASGGLNAAQKQMNRTTLMSVKGIKNLWRKSNKNSVSGVSVNTGARTISSVPENAYSPLSPPPPQRPNRPSMEDMDLPDVDVPPPPRTPITSGFGNVGRPPMPQQPRSPPATRPSMDRPPPVPQDSLLLPRPSQERTQSQMSTHSQISVHSQMSGHSQLSVPPPMLRSTNNTPIVAAKAAPPRKPMDGLSWDQESPYPTRAMRAPSIGSSASRPNSRPPSSSSMSAPAFTNANGNAPGPSPNPSPPNSTPSTSPPAFTNAPPPPAESHRNSVRKSILKWKSVSANGGTRARVHDVVTALARVRGDARDA
ncbi:hypothetical protein B0H15DRAFT_192261 [Mycena belliarum]|uniref:Uncharacterized protein n=1 Tax=Mycena belliarum TaxID=1033014 RepID=A0AAD6ULB5_9AGAR|nr:hypothetical protein B0H15DRAFT_192261 [Mycena belliae]